MSRVAIIHDALGSNSHDEQDTLIEVDQVQASLKTLGHEPVVLPFTLDLPEIFSRLTDIKPKFIFNMVETQYPLIYIAPGLFEYLKIPYTGCSSEAIFLTTNKMVAKKIMHQAHILSPLAYQVVDLDESAAADIAGKTFIIKPVTGDASLFINDEAMLTNPTWEELRDFLISAENRGRCHFFAEEYIAGREFNVSIMGTQKEFTILPLAEMNFLDYPDGKPKIMSYNAKWLEDSFEYEHTQRTFDFTESDHLLRTKLRFICEQCWRAFSLNGYARVDFRVNDQGQAFVLEINANPGIEEYSGFPSACKQHGLTYDEMIAQLITLLNT